MNQSTTIAAIATPNGKSALAIIRITGAHAFEIVARCIREKTKFDSEVPNKISLYTIIDSQTNFPLDEATIIKYSTPRSFTGENMVEIICHGGPRIVDEIAIALLDAGAKPAARGEFSQRAIANGKMDLLKAEAIRGMIESTGDIDLACSRKLYENEKKISEKWRSELIEISAKIEAEIEFGEEEKTKGKKDESKEILLAFIIKLEKDINKRKEIKSVENFISIVIAGLTNAGKSSLFNLLLENERSIVHHEPGTTRDIISERVWICGYQTMLIDSAGIRETKQEIEKEGILRTRAEIKKAGIILWVTDANKPLSDEEIEEIKKINKKELICVINKIDLSKDQRKKETLKKLKIETIEASIKMGININKIVGKIGEKLKKTYDQIEVPDIVLNKRQEETAMVLKDELLCALNTWEREEIAAYHLKKSIGLFDELLGKTDNEEVLKNIFSSFCIGK